MQIGTGSDDALILKNFWQEKGRPKFKRSYLELRQFDGSCITTLGQFKTTFADKENIEIIPIIVVDCFKNPGLIGTDILKIDTTKLIDNWQSEEQKVGVLKGFEATIRLKGNISPSYSESRRIPIQFLLLVNGKLKQMVKQGSLEHVPKGGSNWTSLIVISRKADGDLRICGVYKIKVNHKMCSDSFPISNVETILHNLTGKKYFTKLT